MRSSPTRKRLFQLAILMGCVLGLLFWKVDYVYEVALFNQLAHATPATPKDSEAALFDLTTHQISRNLYIKNERSPLVFLLNGFALCDQQAKVLTRLLYFNGVKARAVPLYFQTGTSNHTIFEWFDNGRWLIADPFLHFPLNITAEEFLSLDLQFATSDYQRRLIRRAYEYYSINQDLIRELKETYAKPDHSTWEYFRDKPETRLIEWIISSPLKLWPEAYLRLLNATYRLRHFHADPLLDRYVEARHMELLGDCKHALEVYRSLLSMVRVTGKRDQHVFALNQGMLKSRIVSNRRHCTVDHPESSKSLFN
ncbi:MAG: hypothetical protein RL333_2080 [Pseudomonadota bacterium]|jgi:hypothetical protein